MSVQTQIDRIAGNVSEQNGLIQQIKTGLTETAENLARANNEISTQSVIIQQIQESLEGKAAGGGGTQLPTLTNPGTANDLVFNKQLIDAKGRVVTGLVIENDKPVFYSEYSEMYTGPAGDDGQIFISPFYELQEDVLLRKGTKIYVDVPAADYGDVTPEDVAQGKTFTSASGFCVTGTANMNEGFIVKSGTTTSRTINTGLSEIEQFFMYKETQTGTGLIRLHYTKTATSRMYASAWSTQNYGTKTITNGTGGVTVSGGSVTISATNATQGALTSNTTYKWVAVGKE